MRIMDNFHALQRIPVIYVLSWISLFKFIYWAVLLLAVKLWGSFEYFDILYWPQNMVPTFASHFIPYDGCFYLNLSKIGYQSGDRACAFNPLWPLIMRWASHLTGGNVLVTGLILANVFSLIAWLVFYQIVSKRWGPGVAKWALVFLVVFPGSLFYQFLYSESLFLLLVMGLWWGLEHKRNTLALGMAFLLPLTRPIGVFCFSPSSGIF